MARLSSTEQHRLGLVRPELMRRLLQLLDLAGEQLGFTCAVPEDGGTRSLERQTALYQDSIAEGGGTLAYPVGKPGHSRHNYGAAFDLHIVAGGSGASGTGTDDDYRQLAALAEGLPDIAGVPTLTAGYYFAERDEGQSDPYHFQLNEPLQESVDKWNAMKQAGIVKIAALVAVIGAGLLTLRR